VILVSALKRQGSSENIAVKKKTMTVRMRSMEKRIRNITPRDETETRVKYGKS